MGGGGALGASLAGPPHHLALPQPRGLFLTFSCPSARLINLTLGIRWPFPSRLRLLMLVYPATAICGEICTRRSVRTWDGAVLAATSTTPELKLGSTRGYEHGVPRNSLRNAGT